MSLPLPIDFALRLSPQSGPSLSPQPHRKTTDGPDDQKVPAGRNESALSEIMTKQANINPESHWEKIHSTRAPNAVSWYRAHLETSLALIERAAGARSASIVDVGGGESTLVDDLLARGYQNITVLDISETAIDVTKKRLEASAKQARWLVANITKVQLEPNTYDVWHDRAVFHFLTTPEQRAAYVCQVAAAVRPEATSS
jgi:2-polyprenyl-3-methyl-5-hydroxy-6-metoxy-1,4-benzoquinol methylase